jgi:asparagine synthase (glutamine-hydrolysing)
LSGRYLCFITPGRAKEAADGPPRNVPAGFEAVLRTEDLVLFANDQLAFEPPQSDGYAIVGLAFPHRLSASTSSQARALLESHWGMFVGFKSGADGQISVVRDSSGQLPCYYRADGTGWVIASDLDLLRTSCSSCIEIDWAEVGDELLFINHFSARTALLGIRELLPGEALIFTPEGPRMEFAWNPWDHALAPIQAIPDAVARLRASLMTVHETIAGRFPRPLITVSGGLDSSIVATEIARHTNGAKHLTFFTPSDPLGDERSFARALAHACAAPLAEAPYKAPDFAVSCRTEMFLPRPTHRTIAGLINARIADQAYLGGHDAILGGYGGDNIFHVSASAYALGDRLGAGSGFAGILATMRDLRRITSASYYDLLRHSMKVTAQRLRPTEPFCWGREPTFLTKQVARRRTPSNLHPWLIAPDGAKAGSVAQIASLIGSHNYLERVPRTAGAAHIWPLLFSPIVEACLSIPSWLWCAGGVDRAIARVAASALPPAIANRRNKGSPLQMHARYFETYQNEITQLLCEGMLADQRIVDADAIRRYCQQPPPVRDLHYLRVLELVDAELWCRFQT